jgi:UDP-glucose 4-epimerase
MKLLVTGGAGYVGAAVARQLLDAGHEVVIVDDLSRNDAGQIPSDAHFEQLRVHEIARVLTPQAGFDGVLHFAGLIAAGESMAHPDWHWDNNTRASLALLDAVREAGTPRLIFSSTAAVYGEPTALPITEDAPTDPVNTYGDTKLAVDRAIASTTRVPGNPLGAVSLRYFNVAGALKLPDGSMIGERHDPETHIIPLALDVVAGRREKFVLFGQDYPTSDGTCVRDYVHVADLAAAHLLALKHVRPGEHRIYNLGNGTGHSNLEVVTAIRDVTGHDLPLEIAARRPGDPASLYASSEKARTELGWRPRYSDIRQIVADAWAFHQTRTVEGIR